MFFGKSPTFLRKSPTFLDSPCEGQYRQIGKRRTPLDVVVLRFLERLNDDEQGCLFLGREFVIDFFHVSPIAIDN